MVGEALDRSPDAHGTALASFCFRANLSHQPAGMIRSITERIKKTGSEDCRGRFRKEPSAQFPEGVGRSRPLWVVSLTSGAGGASSPAMAGVISAGTEAMVVAGFTALKACWPAP